MGKTRKVCKKDAKCCKVHGSKIPKQTENITARSLKDLIFSNTDYHNDLYSTPLNVKICCKPYRRCAENITDLTILLAESLINETVPKIPPSFIKDEEELTGKWPNNGQLNLFSGMESLDNYIQSFDYGHNLNYCINYISQKSDSLYTSFLYEVMWSMPTKEEPVQLATASMYFCLKMYYYHGNDTPVEVTYNYEYSNMTFYSTDPPEFREDWILNIINSKLEFMKKNNFKVSDQL